MKPVRSSVLGKLPVRAKLCLRAVVYIISATLLAACSAPTSTTSKTPLLLYSPAIGEIPANFVIYNPELMGTAMQAEFRSDGSGHHVLFIGSDETGSPEQVRAYLRVMRLPLFPDHFVAQVTTSENSQQILVKRTAAGFVAETIDLAKVLKKQSVPGIEKTKGKETYEAASLDAVTALFWRALDLSNKAQVPKSDPYVFAVYDLDHPQGRPAYDAARAAEAARLERKKVEEAERKKRVAAKKEKDRKRREAERQRKKAAEAARRAAMVANNNKRYGDWIYRIELDQMTDKKKQYVYGFPQGFDNPDKSPYLRIGCYGAAEKWPMGVTFYWGQSLEDIYPRDELDLARVTVRFGSGKPQEMGWAVSQDWASTYPPNNFAGGMAALSNGIVGMFLPNAAVAKMNTVWEPIDLHRALKRSQTVTFRGYPRSGQSATYVFDLSGYQAAASNFEPHCNK